MTPLLQRNLRLLYAFWFLREFQLWIPVWIVFLTVEQGFSLTEVTGVESLFLIGILVLEVPTGAVADRWGRSPSLALGAFVLAVAVLLFAFTTSFAVLVASFLLWSAAHTLMSGADMALLYESLKTSGREGDYERIAGRGAAIGFAAAGLGTFLGGPVAAMIDIRATIIIGAGTCLVGTAIAWLMIDPPRSEATEGGEKTRYLATIGVAFREIWHAPDVRAVVLLTGAATAGLTAVGYLVQPYLLNRDISVGVLFSMLQVPMILAGVGGALIAGRLALRHGTTTMLTAPLLGAACFAALMLTPGLAAYPALPLLYVLVGALRPVATGYVNRRIASDRRATVLSMHGMVSALLLAALAPAIGFVADHGGLSWAFALGGAACVASVVVFGAPVLAHRRLATEPLTAIPADAA